MTLLRRLFLPVLAAGLLGVTGSEAGPPSTAFEPGGNAWVAPAPSPPPDTVRASADAGTPLILPLPKSLNEHPVARYTLLRGPALSGVAGRSFTWIPEGAAPGIHRALLQAEFGDAPPDTLVVQIRFRP
ncbi:hypothetical protein [Salinibacter ruber]|uniref:Uncharacterized protein n=1 Tax=Salinibacter ruber TaxID=146919 RepID=A0A9X2UIR9_9BACT|nr:hypothetical protein [Salinibacter ruber]MCS3611174.1 hypothetical protein [Salinibacter ruber]MCS3614487.1 hypothetical protein [Salinibacter ruber]MCS3646283.1 hypothetical protein [Salinibacter ruber]MCS3673169.1 hypothetical protein [Salinibacter ruber]MCS3785470.1 hypothetical protein [Salinibacter ruber]